MKNYPILFCFLLIFVSVFALFIYILGCDFYDKPKKPELISEMKRPIIVVAKKSQLKDIKFSGEGCGCIMLKSSDGHYLTFNGCSLQGAALVNTYNVGDTIR